MIYIYIHIFMRPLQQHIAAFLQLTPTHWSFLQHTATQCDTLQHTATHCNAPQHFTTHCNTLQHTATHCNTLLVYRAWEGTRRGYDFNTATHCNTLQHTATHCNTLQHTAGLSCKASRGGPRSGCESPKAVGQLLDCLRPLSLASGML